MASISAELRAKLKIRSSSGCNYAVCNVRCCYGEGGQRCEFLQPDNSCGKGVPFECKVFPRDQRDIDYLNAKTIPGCGSCVYRL